VKRKTKQLTIQQSMEGLYTPRYENYEFNIIGLPFKPARIIADNKEVKDFVINKDKTVKLKLRKNFMQLVID
jgi:alpha-glucosidase